MRRRLKKRLLIREAKWFVGLCNIHVILKVIFIIFKHVRSFYCRHFIFLQFRSTVKVKYMETKVVKSMRETFEKAEQRALRSDKLYRVDLTFIIVTSIHLKFYNSQPMTEVGTHRKYFFSQAITKEKKVQKSGLESLSLRGGGESYIDATRGIAQGMGKGSFILAIALYLRPIMYYLILIKPYLYSYIKPYLYYSFIMNRSRRY